MAINGVSNVLLVTSSRFTKGVTDEIRLAAQRGFFVELVDGARFLEALNLTYRSSPPKASEIQTMARPSVKIIYESVDI